jgi:hypothetical protein
VVNGCKDEAVTKPRSLHTEVVDAVRELNERDGPTCLRDLLYAEVAVRKVAPSLVEMTSAVHRPDGGIDAVTAFPFEIKALGIPAGELVWQVKTGATKPSAAAELGESAKHHDAQREVAAGADYVLVWTSDQPRKTRLAIQNAFAHEARKLRREAKVYVLLADNLAVWAWRYPQVLLELVPLDGLRPIGPLDGTEVANGTTDVEQRIRLYFASPMGHALRIAGPQGSGKSTAIRLAANTLSEHLHVLVARDPSGVGANLLTRFAHRRVDVGIVIERCPPAHAATLEHLVADSDGHLRLVTEGSASGWSYFRNTDVIEVQPMMANMDRRLLDKLCVPPVLRAELVGSTGGNPMLLSALAQGKQELSGDAVRRMTDGLDIRALASLALMPPLTAGRSDTELIATVTQVPIEILDDTAAGLADRNLIQWVGHARLPAALASAALRDALSSRPTWLEGVLERLPDEYAPAAIGPLAAVGRGAEAVVGSLFERADRIIAVPSDGATAYEVLDRLGLATAVIPAVPLAAAQRLNELARQFPWGDQHGLAIVAVQDFLTAAERLDQVDKGEAIGARLVLEVIGASGFRSSALRTALRSTLRPGITDGNLRGQTIRDIAEDIGGAALEEFMAAEGL